MSKAPKPPADLSPATRAWWKTILDAFVLEDHHLRLLEAACRAWDRAEEARMRVAEDGAFIADRFGQLKVHPGVDIERKSRDSFRLMLRELGLDVVPANEARAPQPGANAHLRLHG
ncbi:MAG: P27 family phage terminase small subunit [Longimicrobiales bacterium]|nr:P27 family phage terminase small subunit [Longimicrobiales bacterium]